jgi:hypothetical protein
VKINKISIENADFQEGKLSGSLKLQNGKEEQLFEGKKLLHVDPQLSRQEIRKIIAAVELAYKTATKHSHALKSTLSLIKNWLKSFQIIRLLLPPRLALSNQPKQLSA